MTDPTVTLRINAESGQLVGTINVSKSALTQLGTTADTAGKTAAQGIDKATAAVDKLGKVGDQTYSKTRQGVESISKSLAGLQGNIGALAGIGLSVAKLQQGVAVATQMADAYTNLTSKIRNVTDSEAELVSVRQQVFDVSQDTRVSFESTVELYTRMSRATESLGLGQQRLIGITETINQAFIVSGATGQEASNAIIQLTQGLAAGALRGEEFNSVAEQAPLIMDLLGKSLGKTRGELRAMAADGEITAEVLINALSEGAASVSQQFDNMQLTIGGALTQLDNAVLQWIGSANEATGVSVGIAEAISFVARNAGDLLTVLTPVAIAIAAVLVPALASAVAGTTAFTAALGFLRGALLTNPIGLVAVALGTLVGALSLASKAEADRQAEFEAGISTLDEMADGLDRVAVKFQSLDQPMPALAGAFKDAAVATTELIAKEQELSAKLAEIEAIRQRMRNAGVGDYANAGLAQQTEEADRLKASLDGLRGSIATASTELSARFAPAIDAGTDAIDRMARSTNAIDGFLALRDGIRGVVDEVNRINEADTQYRALFATIQAGAKATGEELKTAGKSAVQLAQEQVATIESLGKAAGASPEQIANLRKMGAAWIENARGIEQAKGAASNAAKAQRDHEKALRDAERAADALESATNDLSRSMIELAVQNGQMTEAMGEFAEGLRAAEQTANKLREAHVDEREVAAYLEQAVAALSTAYDRKTKAADADAATAARRADVTGRLLADMQQEVYLSGLSTQARRVEEIVLRAVAEAQENVNSQVDGAVALSAERQAQLRGEVAGQLAQIDAIDEAARQQEDYHRIQLNGIDSLSNAIGDFATRNIKTWRDLFGSFKSIALRALSDVVAAFVRQRLLLSVGVGASGTAAAATGAPGAAAAAAGAGGIGGGIGSLLGGIGGLLGGTATGFGTGLLASGSIFSGAGLLGGITGSISAGVASIAGGAITQGIGLLAGPIGLIAGAISIISGLLKNKTPDLRFGGENSNVRKPEGSFSTVFGNVEAGSRLISYEQLIEPIQQFDAGIEQIVNTLGGGSEQLDVIKQRLATWSVDLRGSAATAENVLGSRFSAILSTFSADVQGFVGAAGTVEERVKRLGEALTIEALVGDGGLGDSFAAVSSLLSDYRQGTEDLTATYARVVGSVQLLEAALTISGQSLTLTRDEFVRFAADITDAAGGLEQAQQLWSAYFETFYTEAERQQLAISQAQQRAQQQFDAAGLNLSDFTGDGGLQAFRDLFESLLPSLSADGVVRYLEMANALGVLIDLTAQASDAVDGISGSLADFMADIDAQLAEFAPAPTFAERLAQITANTDTLITRAELLGASEEQIAQIRELGARQYGQVIAEQTEAIGRYQDVVLGIRNELADVSGATEFQRALREIDRQLADNISSLNEAARAAGLQGAAESDLAAAHELAAIRVAQAIARLEERGRSIVGELFGSQLEQLNEQIALIESGASSFAGSASSGFEQVTQAADNAAQAQISAQQRIRDWLDNLLLGELGGLRPRDALAEAQALFDRTLAAALGGDAEAMAALPGLADQLLRLGQQVYGSGDPFFELRDAIRAALEQVASMAIEAGLPPDNTGGGNLGGGGAQGGAGGSGDLAALYAERERLQAEQAAAQRRELALELAGIVRDLVLATGDPLTEIAERLEFNLSDLVAALGVNLEDLTVSTASQLADVAQAMGVNLTELSAAVGVDLGALADRQSLLNDALEAEIAGLPQGQRDLLEPLLRDVEDAAALGDTTGVERGIGLMEDAINDLSPDLRDMLAPYFAGVAPASAFTEIERLANIDNTLTSSLNAHDQTNYLLGEILANGSLQPGGTLGGGLGPVTPGGLPPPSYAVGTTYVPRDGLAMIHAGEAVIPADVNRFIRNWLGVSPAPRIRPIPIVGGAGGAQSNDALIRELQELRRERREADEYTRRLEERLRSLETTTASSARDNVAALDRQTDAMRRGR